jgi:hypothetical protein
MLRDIHSQGDVMSILDARLKSPALLLLPAAVLLAGIVACTEKQPAPGTAAGGAPLVCVNPAPIPANFDYPQPPGTIEKWVAAGDQARARTHGWYLWAALNSGAGEPVWRSWCTSTQAFAGNTPSPSPSPSATITADDGTKLIGGTLAGPPTLPMRQRKFLNGTDPINFPYPPEYPLPAEVLKRYGKTQCVQPGTPGPSLADGPTFENNGDIMVAGVTYDQAAYDWIRSKGLYQTATLQGLLPKGSAQAEMPVMPRDSIVLKPMMWPVPKGGFVALPVWDDQQSDRGQYAGYENINMWPRAVALTTTPQAQVIPASVSFLHGVKYHALPLGPNVYQKPQVVGTDQFYHYEPNLATMDACDRAILDASAYWAYGRMFQPGDQLVMIAMHMITKEQDAWTFQSVWWHDKPDQGPYAANRPNIPASQAPGPWRHYLMTSTYGFPAVPKGTTWPVAYNPYIELAADHPIRTNCMNCHHRAAAPNGNSSYLANPGPGPLDIYLQSDRIFNGLLKTDSMWAISDRVPVPKNTPTPSPTTTSGPVGK